MEFLGRKKELAQLNSLYCGTRKEFCVIYGRRRIGKTELIKEFLKNKDSILFQAKQDSAYGNLRSFSYELNKATNLPKGFVYSSWEEALDAVIDLAQCKRFVLAIDEYPYILEQCPSFSSILQEFIDKAPNNIFLILSGSDVAFLKNEIINHNSPLYKRRTIEMRLDKLCLSEASLFLKDFDDETKCNYLALMSTYPYYLSAINHDISFKENIKTMLFNQYGCFFTLPDQLLSNSTNVQDVYNAILNAIAHRRRGIKEISEYIHEEGPKVSKYLNTLLECEIVVKCDTFNGNKRSVYYEINDPLLKFWYSFIFENYERIKSNGDIVIKELSDKISQFISFGFENVSRLYLDELNESGKLNTVYPPLKTYKVDKSQLGRSIEIDGLAEANNSLLVVDCKYRKIKFNKEMLEHLLESVSIFPDKLSRYYYIFSKSGFEEEVIKQKSKNINLLTLSDLFAI